MDNLHEKILINDCFEVIREIKTESELDQITDKSIRLGIKTVISRINNHLRVFKLKNNL